MALLLCVLPSPSEAAKSCSCTSPGGGCSASVECGGNACIAICTSNDDCFAECLDYLTDRPAIALRQGTASLQGESLSAWRVEDALGGVAGAKVRYAPAVEGETVSLDAKNVPAHVLIRTLARTGAVAVFPEDASGMDAWQKGEISLRVHEATAADLQRMLGHLFQNEVVWVFADPTVTVSMQASNAPASAVVAQLARLGNLSVGGVEIPAAPER